MRPSALFVVYLFPPTGGNSPRMTYHYARALAHAGYDVDVVTPRPSPDHPVYRPDPSWQTRAPDSIHLHYTYPGPFYRLVSRPARARDGAVNAGAVRAERVARTRKWYRRLVRPWILPDSRADWIPWALGRAGALLADRRYDLLFTFGFPFSCHVAGLALHHRRPLPWVAHNGDVWSFQPGNGLPGWRRAVDRQIEGAILHRAARLIVNTTATAEAYTHHFPGIPHERVVVIPTGYERDLYAGAEADAGLRFRLVYTGAIAEGGAGRALLDALALLRSRGARDVECVVAGEVPYSLRVRAQRLELDGMIQFIGFQPATEVARLQKGAAGLVVFGMTGGLQVPCKLLEYFAARRPVLVIASEEADVAAREVRRLRRGLVAGPNPAEIASAILQLKDEWFRGTLDRAFDLSGIPALAWDEVEERFLQVVEAARRESHV